jgi:hypothetical protein
MKHENSDCHHPARQMDNGVLSSAGGARAPPRVPSRFPAAVRSILSATAKGKIMKQLSKCLMPPCGLCLSLLLSWSGYQA